MISEKNEGCTLVGKLSSEEILYIFMFKIPPFKKNPVAAALDCDWWINSRAIKMIGRCTNCPITAAQLQLCRLISEICSTNNSKGHFNGYES